MGKSLPPKDKRITPKCCEKVQTFQAVFLDIPDDFYEGNNDTPPKWVVSCKSDQFDCEGWRQAHFCPFCGTTMPEIVRVDTGEYKVCACTDGGYYCDTCNERIRHCQCFPPTHQWGPKEQ